MASGDRWTLLNQNGESQSDSGGSSAESSDFVRVDPSDEPEEENDLNLQHDPSTSYWYWDDSFEPEKGFVEGENGTFERKPSPLDRCSVSSIEILEPDTLGDETRILPSIISSSSIEELSEEEDDMRKKNVVRKKSSPSISRRKKRPSYEETASENEDYVMVRGQKKVHPAVARLRHSERKDSSSEYSDFVRLDCDSMAEDQDVDSASTFNFDRYTYPHDQARARMGRLQMKAAQLRYSSRDEDADSIPSDVDDRCESDISGVAYDSDLSHRSIGDVPIEAGTRTYKHRPNNSLNTLLTTVALITLFAAVGAGIGHYIGSVREMNLRQAQLSQMKSLQDDFYVCLQGKEKMSRQLKSPSSKEMKLSTAVDIWQQKYEELLLEKADLVNQVREMEAVIANGLDTANQKMQDYKAEAAQISNELNKLDIESENETPGVQMKIPLLQARQEINRLRMRLIAERADDVEGRNVINSLRTENMDLKAEVMRLKYTADAVTEQVVGDSSSGPTESEPPMQEETTQEVPPSRVHRIVEGAREKMSRVYNHIQSTLQLVGHERWNEKSLKTLGKSLEENVSNLGKSLKASWKHLKDIVGNDAEKIFEEHTQQNSETTDSRLNQIIQNTKNGIATVLDEIQTTLNQIQQASSRAVHHDKGLKSLGRALKDNMSSFGKSLKKAWKNISSEIKDKKEGKKNKKFEKDYKHVKETIHGRKDHSRHQDYSQSGSAKIHVTEEDFERKPDHKQKQSTDPYSEFWKQAGFAPDDIFPDDFFEGNRWKWKKHQKDFNKMHGRLRQLNADIVADMEDDDLDDLYDDLDDLHDDLEDEVGVPERLMTWLTCQMRWWKSRLHRKNSDEDPLRGCGHNLMKWQLSVACDSANHDADKCVGHINNQTAALINERSEWFFGRANERGVFRDLAWPLKRGEGRRDLRLPKN